MGRHVLIVSILRHLRVRHRNLVHLGRNGMRVRHRRASLMRRVRKRRCKRAALVMELGSHVRPSTGLVRGVPVIGPRGVGHLILVSRLRVAASATTAALVTRAVGATGTGGDVATHVAMGGLGRLAAQVGGLRTGIDRHLVGSHLSLQAVVSIVC